MSVDVIRTHLKNSEWRLAEIAATAAVEEEEDPKQKGLLLALLSRAKFRLGRPQRALECGERAAALTEHWEVSLSLGEAMLAVGDPLVARTLLRDAVDKLGEALVNSEAEIGLCVALALAWRASGQPEVGLAVAGRGLALSRRLCGDGSIEAANSWYALGVCYHAAGQGSEAAVAIEKCLVIRQAELPGSTDVATALDARGAVLRQARQPFKAVAAHREALAIWLEKLGEFASSVGGCRHSLAQALHRTGDFMGARQEMAQALRITVRNFGPDHVDSWITRFELGRFEVDTGDMEEGFQRMEEARVEVRRRLGEQHPVVLAMDRWL
jgi:tetratricopeptide (TPR) repeat protein